MTDATATRATLKRQLHAVVGMLEDSELSELLDLAGAHFGSPPALGPDVTVHQLDAQLVSRLGWLVGVIVPHVTPLAIAHSWWTRTTSGTALSPSHALARVLANAP